MLRFSAAAVGKSEYNFVFHDFLTESTFFFHNFNLRVKVLMGK